MCWLNFNPVYFLIGRCVFAPNTNKLKCVMNRVCLKCLMLLYFLELAKYSMQKKLNKVALYICKENV